MVRAEALGDSHAWLAELDAAGLDQVMIRPAFAPRYTVLERIGRDRLPQISTS